MAGIGLINTNLSVAVRHFKSIQFLQLKWVISAVYFLFMCVGEAEVVPAGALFNGPVTTISLSSTL